MQELNGTLVIQSCPTSKSQISVWRALLLTLLNAVNQFLHLSEDPGNIISDINIVLKCNNS